MQTKHLKFIVCLRWIPTLFFPAAERKIFWHNRAHISKSKSMQLTSMTTRVIWNQIVFSILQINALCLYLKGNDFILTNFLRLSSPEKRFKTTTLTTILIHPFLLSENRKRNLISQFLNKSNSNFMCLRIKLNSGMCQETAVRICEQP